jgi:GNAT superfamily N-acetyltransferase
MRFRFQVATPNDIPRIRELIIASVRALQLEYSPEQREAALADGTYLLAFAEGTQPEEDGRLAGCGGWSRRKTLCGGDHHLGSISADLLDPAHDAAKIRAIFVHPDFARKGLGSALLQTAEEAAQREGFTHFEMGSTLTGVALYQLKGYEAIEEMDVPVAEGRSISIVRMAKSGKQVG